MDLHLKDPDLQAKVERWIAETGRSADELAEDAIAGYLESLAEERHARQPLGRPQKREGKAH